MDLATIELKFLFQLLGCTNYRSPLKAIKPNPKTVDRERDGICRKLGQKGLVDFQEEIKQFAITSPGKTLLKLDTTSLPVTPDELLILKACVEQPISPQDLPQKLPEPNREPLIQALAQRGLLKLRKSEIQEVWLTAQGIVYLRDECVPRGSSGMVSFDRLGNYVEFLRTTLEPTKAARYEIDKPTPEQVLAEIADLDRQFNTDNYLPIFELRKKLQPPLGREELDQILYLLQRQDRIELGSIQEVRDYSPEQLKAGIPQNVGGALFFISRTRSYA
jgi:hypothetical protein